MKNASLPPLLHSVAFDSTISQNTIQKNDAVPLHLASIKTKGKFEIHDSKLSKLSNPLPPSFSPSFSGSLLFTPHI